MNRLATLRIIILLLPMILLGVYMYCWVSPVHFTQNPKGITLAKGLNLTIDYHAKSIVAYSDRSDGPYQPYIMVTWIVPPPGTVTQLRWPGFYFFNYRDQSLHSWTIGVSLLYLVVGFGMIAGYIEYRAWRSRKRQQAHMCSACGYPRRGLQQQTKHCPECGYEIETPSKQIV